jgi:glutathione reductase (NADPH)
MARTAYDVLILGGGNAAFGVTVPTRAAGLSVAVVEAWDVGGTCPNRGCTPKKVLVAAAHALDEIERASAHGISVGKPRLDWNALISREKQMIARIPHRLRQTLADRGVELIQEKGTFVGPNTVRVGAQILEAQFIVIATGSRHRPLSMPGVEHLITSDEILSEHSQPDELIFIGGGVVALEFSHVYARAGSKVTILEVLPRLFPGLDVDAVAEIRKVTERIGIKVRTGVAIKSIEPAGHRLRVTFEQDGVTHTLESDRVVNGAGRVPNVDTLNLEAATVRHDRGRIAVDDFLRSVSNPSIYVCGDALSISPQLSPVATYEGKIVGRNIVEGPTHRPDYRCLPSNVYTVPALASVGLTEAAAREKNLNVRVSTNDLSDWFSSRTFAETASFAKVIVDVDTDLIVGAHLVGHAGEELINLFAFAMLHDITASQMRDAIYAYPTFSADIKSMF